MSGLWRIIGRRGRTDGRTPQSHVIDARAHGAKGDVKIAAGASIAASERRLSSAAMQFTAADVGKWVIVPGAGEMTITGSYTAESDLITGVTLIAGYGNGSLITGPGIPPGTKITTGAGTGTLVLSNRATVSGDGASLVVQGALHGVIESTDRGMATLSTVASFSVQAVDVSYGTNDTAALSAAIAESAELEQAVHIPAGNYLCLGSICSIVSRAAPVRLPVVYGDGIGITTLTSYLPGVAATVEALFNIAGGHITPWTAAPGLGTAGSRVITLPSTSELRSGQTVHLLDRGQPFLSNSRRTTAGYAGEIVRICEVLSATQVLTYGGLEFTYGGEAHYRVPNHLRGFTLRDLTIRNPAPATQSGAARGIAVRLARDVRVENVRFEALDASAMRFSHVVDFRVDGCEFSDLENVRTSNNPYGVCCTGWCSSGLVIGCISNGGCHLFTAGCNPAASPPSHIVVANCVASNHTKAAFDTHPGSRFITFIGNQAHGCTGPGFQIRGPDSQVIEPIISGLAPAAGDNDGRSGVGVYFVQGADRGRLRGGRISSVPYGVIVRGSNDVSIVGARIQSVQRCGISVQDDRAYPVPINLTIDDVDIGDSPSATGVDFEVWDNSYRLSRVRCEKLARTVNGARPTTVASADTLAPIWASDTWVITGTSQINSIEADMSQFGRRITFIFTDACAVNPCGRGNIRLLSAFAGSPDGTLTLTCDGTSWLEAGRSPMGTSTAA
jgi:hypothetical protein